MVKSHCQVEKSRKEIERSALEKIAFDEGECTEVDDERSGASSSTKFYRIILRRRRTAPRAHTVESSCRTWSRLHSVPAKLSPN